jgi:hypothetical protein
MNIKLLPKLCKCFVKSILWVAAVPAFADCPPGQMPGIDRFGNRACLITATQQVESVQSMPDMCPPGYDRRPDGFGQFSCIDKTTGTNANPRRADCPPRTWLKTDEWGYERCVPVP